MKIAPPQPPHREFSFASAFSHLLPQVRTTSQSLRANTACWTLGRATPT